MMQLLWLLCKGRFVPCRTGTRRLRQDLLLTGISLEIVTSGPPLSCLHRQQHSFVKVLSITVLLLVASCLHVWQRKRLQESVKHAPFACQLLCSPAVRPCNACCNFLPVGCLGEALIGQVLWRHTAW